MKLLYAHINTKLVALLAGVVLSFIICGTLQADSIQERYFLGPLSIDGFNPPPNDISYDWGPSILKIGNTYRMWWVRGVNHGDKIWYADSLDSIHYYHKQQVMEPVNNGWETTHVGHPTVVYVDAGSGSKYYMFYESPMRYDGLDGNIYLATSTDGVSWNKWPSNSDPRPVIEGYNRTPDPASPAHYGVGLPSVYYKDGKFVINYVEDCDGPNKMRRAESYDGIHWGSVAGTWQPDVRNHLITMYGNVGDVKYSIQLSRCVMTFFLNNSLLSPPGAPGMEIYLVTSLDANGKQWAATTSAIWNLADEAHNVSATIDADATNLLKSAPYLACNGLGQLEGSTFQVNYTKGQMGSPDINSLCNTWDLYCALIKMDSLPGSPLSFPEGLNIRNSGGGILKILNHSTHLYCNWEVYCALNPGRESDWRQVTDDSYIEAMPTGPYYLEGLNVRAQSGGSVYWIHNFTRYGYADDADFLLQNPSGKQYLLTDAEMSNVIADFPYMGLRSPHIIPSISEARKLGDGALATVRNKIVTASFDGYFYIEDPDRASGIRVTGTADPGDMVDVSGVLSAASGEPTLVSSAISRFPGSKVPAPLGMNNAAAFRGLSAVGLYVTTWGTVKSTGSNYYWVNDGSSKNLKVYGTGVTRGDYVVVTGAMGMEANSGSGVCVLRAVKTIKP
ncbi:MAG: hypothetical protein ABFD54_13540 [Armatimonadota bacterium]|nr:hypothetical protein [bacterium]